MEPILVSSSGIPLQAFGGADAWKVYQSGDYMVSIEMVEGEPACVIWPAHSPDAGVYAVCLSAFPYWMGTDGRPTQEGYAMALRGLERMGRDVSRGELVRLMTTVIDAFTWVVRMPPQKVKRPDPIYEATALVNGKTFHERAI